MWIARFGRTLTGQVPDGVQPRLAPPRQAGAPATLAGQAPPSWNSGTATNNNAAPDGTSRQAPGTATRSGRSREKAKNNKRQKLLRLVVDQVLVRGWRVEIKLRIPLEEPPSPPHRALSSKDRLRSLGINERREFPPQPQPRARKGHREPIPAPSAAGNYGRATPSLRFRPPRRPKPHPDPLPITSPAAPRRQYFAPPFGPVPLRP